jgi:hypothetical protein
VSLLEGLAVADLADGPVAGADGGAGGGSGADHGVLVLRAGVAGQPGEIPAGNGGVATARWIRAFTHSLMDLDLETAAGPLSHRLLWLAGRLAWMGVIRPA